MGKKEKVTALAVIEEQTAPDLASPAKRKATIEEIEIDVSAPEPPSKRAKRALKKGKPLPAKPKSDDEASEADGEDGDRKERASKEEKTPRSEHGVWIGNLPFTVTNAELKKWLVDNSGGVLEEEAITRIKIPTSKDPGRDKTQKPANKGFAYVDFSDLGGKVAAIALSETEMGGRRLLIKDATSFEGRPKKEPEPLEGQDGETGENGQHPDRRAQSKVEANASRKIFVGNMSFQTSEEDVRRNFEKCGEIDWVKIAQFEDSGKCKGYGWVMFREAAAAAWAVKGFVKIKEKVETEEDFKDADEEDVEAEDDDDGKGKQQEKQFKTRKWWVNRIMGRTLKIELAEDDLVRYKKRFGKDAQKERPAPKSSGGRGEGREKRAYGDRPEKRSQDISVARLTGGLVEHTGSKVTFD